MNFVSDTAKRLPIVVASIMAFALCLSVLVAPSSASASALSEDDVKSELLAQPETREIAKNLGVSPETVANDLVTELGTQAASDVAKYISENEINVDKNWAEAKSSSQSDSERIGPITPQKTCAKSVAAASLFNIWGTAICSAAAASSVGTLGLPCTLILIIGSNSLDWGQVCD